MQQTLMKREAVLLILLMEAAAAVGGRQPTMDHCRWTAEGVLSVFGKVVY